MITFDVFVKDTSEAQFYKDKLIKEMTLNGLEYSPFSPDYVLIVGGDGAVLRGVGKFKNRLDKTKFITIHDGTLGFFADFQKDDIDKIVEIIKNGSIIPTKLALVEMHIKTLEGKITKLFALNEVRVQNSIQTLIADVYINDEYLEKFRGVGFCICSPSGSTAYNKSLGGAVLKFDLDAFQVTEMASINHNVYHSLNSSLILGRNNVLKIVPLPKSHLEFGADCDYWINKEVFLKSDDDDISEILCNLSDKSAQFIIPDKSTYTNRLKRCFII